MSPSWSRREALLLLSGLLCRPLLAADVEHGSDVDLKLEEGGKDFTNSIGMKLVRIPKGKFQMGSPQNEVGGGDSERPQHEVEITKDFHVGIYVVTQKQWQAVMGTNPARFNKATVGQDTDDFPIENVSWDLSVQFIEKLNNRTEERQARRKYRLPTEAEWEYCCRAGTKTAFHYGDALTPKDANYSGTVNRTSKVGSYKPNAWGLYDMHGNVLEWCSDNFTSNAYTGKDRRRDPKGPAQGQGKVLRGGSWSYATTQCRSASRTYATVTNWGDNFVGFRVACDLRRD